MALFSRRQSLGRPLTPDRPSDSERAFEICRLEYEAVRLEVDGLLADVNRGYTWVLGAVAVVFGSQLFGSDWAEVQRTLDGSPWILTVVAIAGLWFPAYDLTRWSDIKVALTYQSEVLLPRLVELAGSSGALVAPHWRSYRDDWQARRLVWLMPVWLLKFALPYVPGVLAFWAFWRQFPAGPSAAPTWALVTSAIWLLLLVTLLLGLVGAVNMPRAQSHARSSGRLVRDTSSRSTRSPRR